MDSDVPPLGLGLLGGLLGGGLRGAPLNSAGLHLDRDELAELLTVGVAEGEVDVVDLAVGSDVGAHRERDGEGGSSAGSDLLLALDRERSERELASRLLVGEGDLAVGGVGLLRGVVHRDLDGSGLARGHLDDVLGLARDDSAVLAGVLVLSALLAGHPRLAGAALVGTGLLLLVGPGEPRGELTHLLAELLGVELALRVGAVLVDELLHHLGTEGHDLGGLLLNKLVGLGLEALGEVTLLLLSLAGLGAGVASLALRSLVLGSGSVLLTDVDVNVLDSLNHFVSSGFGFDKEVVFD